VKKKHPEKQRGQKPLMEELEPRILMSASLEGLLVDDNSNLNNNNYTQSSEHLVITENDIVTAEADDSVRRELVIVDTDTPNFQFLLDDLLNQQTSERQFDVLLLDNNQNGIDQITAALGNYQNLDAIHIVSDGNNGNIDLGNSTLSYNNIDLYSSDIASWSNALAQDADILIYSCELASGAEGINLIDSLSVLTGADIAASDDLTGAKNLGGDWELEYQNGNIETQLAFSLEAQQNWSNVLASSNINFSGTVYESGGNTNIGTGSTITLIVNGTILGNAVTDTNGNYSITASADVNNGDAVVIFIDDNNGTYQSTLVTETNGSTNLTGLNLIDDTLTLRSDNGGNLTNAEMLAAIGNNGDSDILFNVNGTNKLTVEGSTTELYIAAGQTYAPGGDIDTNNMRIQGTFQGDSETTDLSGDFTVSNGGTFNAENGTLSLNENAKTIDAGTVTFNDVVIQMRDYNILTLDADMDIDGDLILNSLSRINGANLLVSGNVTTNDSSVPGSSTFVFDGDEDQLLTVTTEGVIGAISGIEVNKSNNSTLTIEKDIRLQGTAGFLYIQGDVDASTSTLYLNDFSKTINASAVTFNNVVIQMGTLTLVGDMNIDGDLTLNSSGGINGANLLVSGNVTTNTNNVFGSATFVFDGDEDQLLTVTKEGVIGAISGIEVNKSGGILTIEKNIRLQGPSGFLYSQGNVDASESTLYLSDFSKTINAAAVTFNNVVIEMSNILTLAGEMNINGNLTINSANQINGYNMNIAGNLRSIDNTVSGNTTLTLDGSGTQLIGGGGEFSEGSIIINGGGTVELTSAVDLNSPGQDLTIADGTLDLKGFNLTVYDVFTVNNDQTLQLQGNETVSFGSLLLGINSEVIYTGTNSPTSYNVQEWAYQNLALNGENGVFNITTNTVIAGNLKIDNGTLVTGGLNLEINGTFSNEGSFSLRGDETLNFTADSDSGTTIYTGNGAYNDLILGDNYNNLTFDGNGTWVLNNDLDVNRSLNIISGTLDVNNSGNYSIEIFRDWTNTGTFLAQGGTVTFDGGSATITTGNFAFNNLTFASNGTITTSGITDINGDFTILAVNTMLGGNITVAGDITTTDNASLDSPSTTLIIVDGISDQTISAVGTSGTLSGIEIDKSLGTLYLEDTLTIDSNRGWNYIQGNVEAGSSTIIFDNGSATIDAQGMSFNNVTFATPGNINIASTLDIDGDLVIAQANTIRDGEITIAGNLTNNVTSMSSPNTFFTLDGDGIQNISSVAGALYPAGTFTINKNNGTVQLLSDFSPAGDLTITQGVLNLNGNNFDVGNNFTVESAGTLQLNGNESVIFSNQALNTGSTVTYVGTETYTINDWVYQNLSFNNATGTYQFDNAATILGNLIIDAGTVDINGNNLTVSNTFSNSGTLQLIGTEAVSLTMDTDSGTVEYTGNSNYSGLTAGNVYYNLNFNDNGTYELQAALNVNNTLSITNGTLDTNNINNYSITVNGNLSQTGGQIVANNSSITVGGDFTASSGESNTGYSNSTITLNGNADQTLTSGGNQLNNLVLNTNNNIIIADELDINGNFILNSGNLDIARFDVQLYTAGNVTFALNTSVDITARNANWTFDGTSVLADNTLGLQNLGDVVIDGTSLTLNSAAQMQNLTISNGDLNLNGSNITVDSNLTVTSGSSLTLNGDETVTTGNLTLASGSLVVYNGVGNYNGLLLSNNYSNLSLNNGTWTLDNDLNVDGNITISNDATLDAGANQQINIAGTWDNTANFNAKNGTVILDGINQSILGSTRFFDFTKIDAINDDSDVSIFFDSNGTQTIDGTLTLQGLDSNNRVNLISNIMDSQWSLVLASTAVKSINFVTVRDSNASGSDENQIPINATNSVNNGNNTAWTFNDAPTAANNTITASEDTVYIFTLSDFNFSDINSDSFDHIRITDLESAGSLLLNGVDVTLNQSITAADINAGNLTFAAAANENGSAYDSFQFRVNDGTVDSASSYTMTLNVNAVNDAPTASNQTITTDEDTPYAFTLSDFSYSDIDNNAFDSISIAILETSGSLQLNGVDVALNQSITAADINAGNLTFAAAANENGSVYDSFQFRVNDGTVDSVSSYTMTLNVNAVNDAPTASNQTITTDEDTPYAFTLFDFSYSDIDNDAFDSISIATLENSGSLQLNGVDVTLNQSITAADINAGNLTFSPAVNENGNAYDSFQFRVNDGTVDSVSNYTMTINVNAVNDAPTASNQTITTDEDTPYAFTLSDFSYSDIDNDAFDSISIATLENSGSLQLNGVDVALNQSITVADINAGNLVFTPEENANGNNYDQFEFRINDGSTFSDNAYTLTINVNSINDAPTALDGALTINEDELTLINITDLIASGSDLDGDTLTLLTFTQPENGTLKDNGDGTLTYSPKTDYNGEDSFSYTLADGPGNSVIATMVITITPVDDIIITEEALQPENSTHETTEATETLIEETVETLTQSIEKETTATQEKSDEAAQEQITEPNNEEEEIAQPETSQSSETTTADLSENNEVEEIDEATEENQVNQQATGSAVYYWDNQPIAAHQLDADLAQLAKINPALAKELNALTRSGTVIPFSTQESSYSANVPGFHLLKNEYSNNSLYNNDAALWNALDEMAVTMSNNNATSPQAAQQELVVSVATGAAWSVSAGIVASSLRSGSLVAYLMSSVPLWSGFDPLPVLSISADELIKQQEQYDQEADKENNKYHALEKVFD